jgi:type III secretion system YscQ/HrcQ family protein
VTSGEHRLTALAAAVAPARAPALLLRLAGPRAAEASARAAELAAAPRLARLAALGSAAPAAATAPAAHPLLARLAREAAVHGGARPGRGRGPSGRGAAAPACPSGTETGGTARDPSLARAVETGRAMALPFPVPAVSRGFAALTPAARRQGRAAGEAAARAIADLLGAEVRCTARATPAVAEPVRGVARVRIALEALPASAALEVEARLVARVAAALAGAAQTPAALALTDLERALLELAALAVIDALPGAVAEALGPRLAAGDADADPGPGALAVAIDLQVGTEGGRARLLLPSAALAALAALAAADADETAPAPDLAVGAALRRGSATISAADLEALAPGDVLLLDPGAARAELLLPGGLALRGELEGTVFQLQEVHMIEAQLSYPITLAVEIARVTVTVADLARLEPGAALPLDVRRDGAVVLRAGEHAVARGQLVEVDGALGVRVLELGRAT